MIRLLVLALAAVGAIVIFCKLFHDGVMCGFREKEVFKNPAQIEMCPDHDSRDRRLGRTRCVRAERAGQRTCTPLLVSAQVSPFARR
ncbi:MAG: hypothetical protein ACYS0E_00735 [Planctomycetota bacterium]